MPLILNPAAAFTQKGLKPSMNGESIFDVIIQGYSSLTRSEIRVADYILKHKPELPYIMSKTLADACQVSEATITRFCRSVAAPALTILRYGGSGHLLRQHLRPGQRIRPLW